MKSTNLLMTSLLLMFSSLRAYGVNTSVLTKTLSNLSDVRMKTPLSQARRVFLLQQVMHEALLSPLSLENLGDKKKEFDEWFDQLIKNKYEQYLAGWSVVALEDGKVEVRMNLAKSLFVEDLKKSGFIKVIDSTFVDQFAARGAMDVPTTAIFIDETLSNAFVYPSVKEADDKSAPTKSIPGSYLWMDAKGALKGNEKIDLTVLPYADRPLAYSKYFLSQNKNFKVTWDKTFAKKMTSEINKSLMGVKSLSKHGLLWPELGFFTQPEKGLVLLFSSRASGKLSILNRIDANLWWNSKRMRVEWSREMNDPLTRLTTSEALHSVAQKLNQLVNKESLSAKKDEMLRVQFDKALSENQILEIEKQLKTMTLWETAGFIPDNVNHENISVRFPLTHSRTTQAAKLLVAENPTLQISEDKKPGLIKVSLKTGDENGKN